MNTGRVIGGNIQMERPFDRVLRFPRGDYIPHITCEINVGKIFSDDNGNGNLNTTYFTLIDTIGLDDRRINLLYRVWLIKNYPDMSPEDYSKFYEFLDAYVLDVGALEWRTLEENIYIIYAVGEITATFTNTTWGNLTYPSNITPTDYYPTNYFPADVSVRNILVPNTLKVITTYGSFPVVSIIPTVVGGCLDGYCGRFTTYPDCYTDFYPFIEVSEPSAPISIGLDDFQYTVYEKNTDLVLYEPA
jgi:hypothetical protein